MLSDFLAACEPDETHLVLSANSSSRHVADTLQRFKNIEANRYLITKLDEAVDLGAWLPLLLDSGVPVSYLTTGQQVPQDIVVANPRRLARELLGSEQPNAMHGATSLPGTNR